MAKQISFDPRPASRAAARRRQAGRRGQGHPRPARPVRGAGQEVRWPDHHQRRRHHRPRHRAGRPVREPRRPAGQDRRHQDQRRRRRRHHHRDRAGPGNGRRGPAQRRGGRQPDGAAARASPRRPTGSTRSSRRGPPRWPATATAIAQVGTIASRDELIGDLLGEAMEKVGADGVVSVEEHPGSDHRAGDTPTACSSTRATSRRTSPPIRRPSEAVLENAYVLLRPGEDLGAGRPAAAAGEGARRAASRC